MPSPTVLAVRDALRGQDRPLALKELTPLVLERITLTTKKPEQTVRNALQTDMPCVSDGEGHWVYLPTFVRGAAMRSPVRLASPETGELVVAGELVTLLWPLVEPGQTPRAARLKLDGGPTVRVGWSRKNRTLTGYTDSVVAILKLPDPFWSWWGRQQAQGANTLVVRCEDGETGRYACRAVALPVPTAPEVAELHRPLHEAAEKALRRSQRSTWLTDLAGRLLARGIYHRDDPADLPPSFLPGLMTPLGHFVIGRHGVIDSRSDITPGLARLLATRLIAYWYLDEDTARQALGLPTPPPPVINPTPQGETPPVADGAVAAETAAAEGVRLKVTLTWQPDVWRRIELRGDQTLEDLHDAIQDAFGWDDRHLYAFFMSGQAWDELTLVSRPIDERDVEPTADEVFLADLDFRPGRHFLYVFDFGDDLRHLITWEGTFPVEGDGEARFPRVIAGEGEAEQYEDEDEEAGWDEEDWDAEEAGAWGEGEAELGADALADLIDEGITLGLIPAPGASYPSELFELPDLASLGIPTLTRFDFPTLDPRLRRLRVDLDELGSAFVQDPADGEYRLDLTTGGLLWLGDDPDDPEERARRAAIAADPLRYARLPVEGNEGLRRDLEDFLPTVEDEYLRERLTAALASTRPRRRAFDALAHDQEEQQRWVDFSERRLAERIVAWLASRGVAPDLPGRQR